MTTVEIPESFARCMRDVYGESGAAWIVRLPSIVAECEQRWEIAVDAPFALTYNYVAPARRADGTLAVLKVGYPCGELLSEIAALKCFDGHGIGTLLASDADLGAMLLERLLPGETLDIIEDDVAATAAAVNVMRALWVPPPTEYEFTTIEDWGRGFERLREQFGAYPPFSPSLTDRAEELYGALAATSAEPVLLHGDLHHLNILSAQREPWLAIDPKGVVGEPAYETGAWLRNPRPSLLLLSDPRAVLARRVAQFADELGFDRQRIRDWGIAQAVLSAWWSYEDHGHGWEFAITCAELLAEDSR